MTGTIPTGFSVHLVARRATLVFVASKTRIRAVDDTIHKLLRHLGRKCCRCGFADSNAICKTRRRLILIDHAQSIRTVDSRFEKQTCSRGNLRRESRELFAIFLERHDAPVRVTDEWN